MNARRQTTKSFDRDVSGESARGEPRRVHRRPVASLRWTFLVWVFVPTFLVMAFLGSWLWITTERLAEQRLREDLQLIGQTIRRPVIAALERADGSAMQATLDAAFETEPVFGVYVYDAEGALMAAIGPPALTVGQPMEVGTLESERVAGFEATDDRRDLYSIFLPLADFSGRIRGVLQVTRDLSRWRSARAELRMRLVAAWVGVSLLLVALLLLGYERAVGRPMARLIGQLGALDARAVVPEQGAREWRRIAHAISSMLQRRDALQDEARRAREGEERAERRMRQAEKFAAIGRVAAGLAHELGTPMGVILGRVQRLERKAGPLPEPAQAELSMVRAEIGRVERIVRSLLAFSRDDRGPARPFDVTEVLRGVHAELERRKDERIVVQFDWPEAMVGIELVGDPIRLEAAVRNVADNALRAARGRVRVTLEMRMRPTGAMPMSPRSGGQAAERIELESDRQQGQPRNHSRDWAIVVEDDGPGVPEAVRATVFEPFVTTRSAGEGTGLGLALAAAIAEEHGGRLRLEHSDATGTRFAFIFGEGSQPESGGGGSI